MMSVFEPRPDGKGARLALDPIESSILRSLAVQLLELIGPGPGAAADPLADPADVDPFEALTAALAEGPTEPPADPALARLFPDAYGGPDTGPGADPEELRARSSEFRRYTENDLRARKREDSLAVVRALDALDAGPGEAVLELEPAECLRWLGALNDLRLTLASRLEIEDDEDGGLLYRLPDSDPRKPMVMAYLWLGGLQETLIETL
ncbi:DUF2017 domain-containing protein [Streptomyces sp. BI20]|uniref:DUF2017 domain-containing protein n=1 Tax=Streptomyces sp. BI20 TaxID=3403460 RepID=UPI003C70ECBA